MLTETAQMALHMVVHCVISDTYVCIANYATPCMVKVSRYVVEHTETYQTGEAD